MLLSIAIPRAVNAHAVVYLNGHRINKVLMADEENGVILKYKEPLQAEGDGAATELLFGQVSIGFDVQNILKFKPIHFAELKELRP